jgi:hypothetical protein
LKYFGEIGGQGSSNENLLTFFVLGKVLVLEFFPVGIQMITFSKTSTDLHLVVVEGIESLINEVKDETGRGLSLRIENM